MESSCSTCAPVAQPRLTTDRLATEDTVPTGDPSSARGTSASISAGAPIARSAGDATKSASWEL